jgi:hypothetical protein
MVELGERRRDLETLMEDDFLALEADVCGPFDETGQVALRLDISACASQSPIPISITIIRSGYSEGVDRGTNESAHYPLQASRVMLVGYNHSPIPKFLGVASKRGFFVVFDALEVANGAGAGFFEDLAFGGCLCGH